ncbi:unnamed protein product [Brassica rapa subsp. narinosa]
MVKIYCIGGGYVGGPTKAVIALKCPHMYIVGVIDISVLPINAWNSDQQKASAHYHVVKSIVKRSDKGEKKGVNTKSIDLTYIERRKMF